jgi:hypothetical protein
MMSTMLLAHGGHIAMFLLPVAAVVFLVIALRGETPKRRNAATPVLPTHPLSRRMHVATRPPRAARPAPPSGPYGGEVRPFRAPATTWKPPRRLKSG